MADDNSGNIGVKGVVLTVYGNLKMGRLLLPVTDLTIPIDGIPIVITRVYDSLEAGRSADFGQGWYLGLRDPNIQESVKIPEEERTGIPSIFGDLGSTFKVGTRVTLTCCFPN